MMQVIDYAIEDFGGEVYILVDSELNEAKYMSEWGYPGMDTPHQEFSSGHDVNQVKIRIDFGGKSYEIALPKELEKSLGQAIEDSHCLDNL